MVIYSAKKNTKVAKHIQSCKAKRGSMEVGWGETVRQTGREMNCGDGMQIGLLLFGQNLISC